MNEDFINAYLSIINENNNLIDEAKAGAKGSLLEKRRFKISFTGEVDEVKGLSEEGKEAFEKIKKIFNTFKVGTFQDLLKLNIAEQLELIENCLTEEEDDKKEESNEKDENSSNDDSNDDSNDASADSNKEDEDLDE
jgi:hypothetical protein